MTEQEIHALSLKIAYVIIILAIIGAITVIKFFFKLITKLFKKLSEKKYPKKETPKYSQSLYVDKINNEYLNSSYYLSTHLPLNTVTNDKGKYGEYLIFKKLQEYEKYGSRFLFNCYLPKENNKTTEIDIILLTLNGIFVFESKNYSGWIYGNEKQEIWTQTLPAGNKIHKEHFYNPIMQNESHIKTLKNLIGDTFLIYSVIVFSDNCKLKNITASNPMTEVVCFGYLYSIVKHLSNQQPNSLTQETLIYIYNKLYPYTQVPEEVKRKHAEDIQAKKTKIRNSGAYI